MKEVVEKEGSARESAKRFAYEVLPSLLDNLPDGFAGFLLNALNNGYIPMCPVSPHLASAFLFTSQRPTPRDCALMFGAS
jgi:hypothetical protein